MTWKNALKTKRLKPGKTKMVTFGLKTVMVGQLDDEYFATGGLCRHMGWPLAVKDEYVQVFIEKIKS
jgi:nitrite reductase/ring-hydroxylating ferredoxin subunit